jgi:hypothetical protein
MSFGGGWYARACVYLKHRQSAQDMKSKEYNLSRESGMQIMETQNGRGVKIYL